MIMRSLKKLLVVLLLFSFGRSQSAEPANVLHVAAPPEGLLALPVLHMVETQPLKEYGLTIEFSPWKNPEQLRALVLREAMDPLSEALLMFAARRDHLLQVIEPALARGDVVLCDRFTDATFAYQGYGRGFDLQVLSALERWVQQTPAVGEGLRQPDLTLWFDLPPAVAAQRLAQARTPDRFEAQPLEFFTRVAQGYGQRQAADPGRFARIRADQAPDAVWAEVRAACVGRGWLADRAGA